MQPADVIWRDLEDGVVIVSPGAGAVRVLNGVGADIWRLLDGTCTVAQIEESLLHRYAVSADQLFSDMQRFLEELETRGLLVWKSTD